MQATVDLTYEINMTKNPKISEWFLISLNRTPKISFIKEWQGGCHGEVELILKDSGTLPYLESSYVVSGLNENTLNTFLTLYFNCFCTFLTLCFSCFCKYQSYYNKYENKLRLIQAFIRINYPSTYCQVTFRQIVQALLNL